MNDLKNSEDLWKNIENKVIDELSEKMKMKKWQIKLALEQIKHNNILGYCLKQIRQKKRISAKIMAEKLHLTEDDIKKIESERIVYFPLRFVISYLNELGYILTFKVFNFNDKNTDK